MEDFEMGEPFCKYEEVHDTFFPTKTSDGRASAEYESMAKVFVHISLLIVILIISSIILLNLKKKMMSLYSTNSSFEIIRLLRMT